jgi:competence ComEA-like helix-hairpin-helix protein
MASLDASMLCTVEKRRRSMWYLVPLVVLFAAAASPSAPPAVAGIALTEAMPATATVDVKININTADVKELMKLAGVGRGLAEKIVQYRDAHGPFRKVADLRKVEGVADGLLEKNRTRIVVK